MTTKEFNSLPKAEQRILVCKDVLKQIKASRYLPRVGSYIKNIISPLYPRDSIKENFSKIKECTVCALGACILSTTKFRNILTIKDIREGHFAGLSNQAIDIINIFTPKQIALIEYCFEGNNDMLKLAESKLGTVLPEKERELCDYFYERNAYSDDRLIFIMKHIIQNNGTITYSTLKKAHSLLQKQ